jgi:hypothetical protein
MQGASTVAVAFVLPAAVPAASSAQQAPGVGLPPVPQVPPAPPPVPAPSVPALPAPAPSMPAPSLPAAPAPAPSIPQVRIPSVPEVRLPSVPVPRVPAAQAPRPSSVDLRRPGTGSSGPVGPGAAPGGSGAGAGPDGSGRGSPWSGRGRRERAGLSPCANPTRRAGGRPPARPQGRPRHQLQHAPPGARASRLHRRPAAAAGPAPDAPLGAGYRARGGRDAQPLPPAGTPSCSAARCGDWCTPRVPAPAASVAEEVPQRCRATPRPDRAASDGISAPLLPRPALRRKRSGCVDRARPGARRRRKSAAAGSALRWLWTQRSRAAR